MVWDLIVIMMIAEASAFGAVWGFIEYIKHWEKINSQNSCK